ncbi:MacB family efflux pump subunit [Vineibacter terrae]|uniref:MacB family efflux pump subunit n=1 Tax=Vineibacter terrae TaxID=2586908 RepID=UPI002E2EACEB|nr:MacB family efflux pump subunit [Vineibacter terrae]HEX2886065.1 MacB family efflux pump subunit [Vineibacter terrae]
MADTTDAPLIELRDIRKRFVRGSVVIDVLKGITLSIRAGEFVAVMGASGSGKSTLMNILGCLDRPTAGSYRFAGREVSALDSDRQAVLRREALGFIFQQYNLLATATAAENVEIPAIYAGLSRRDRGARAAALLGGLGLGARGDHRPHQLSGGEQQRVSIARALMNGGKVILADEPTGALDSRNGSDVLEHLERLHGAGHTVVLITHDPNVARRADRIIELRDGLVVRDHHRGGGDRPGARASRPHSPATQAQGDIMAVGASRRCGPEARAPGQQPRDGFIRDSVALDPHALLRLRTRLPAAADIAAAAKMAVRSLRTNIFRTALTLLGIVIGVASVVTLVAVADGTKRQVLQNIAAMGSDLLLVRPGAPNLRNAGVTPATLVAEDAEALAALPGVQSAIPELAVPVTIRYGNADYATSATSTGSGVPQARNWPLSVGTFFNGADVQRYAPVAVLGQTVARILYPAGKNPVGTYVLLNNVPFQVIGVMSAKGATPHGVDQDDIVFVPITTGRLRLHGQRYLRSISVQVRDVRRIDQVQEAVRHALAARHGSEDFQIRNMASVLATAAQTANTLTLLLAAIAAISLVVGGIGVMNVMLVSVTERTREIGIRMATGARRINIMLQFNTEALVVCAIGGIVGVALGIALAWLFSRFGQPVVVAVWPMVVAFGCAFATGLVFGYLPARKAAHMDPVVALGAE